MASGAQELFLEWRGAPLSVALPRLLHRPFDLLSLFIQAAWTFYIMKEQFGSLDLLETLDASSFSLDEAPFLGLYKFSIVGFTRRIGNEIAVKLQTRLRLSLVNWPFSSAPPSSAPASQPTRTSRSTPSSRSKSNTSTSLAIHSDTSVAEALEKVFEILFGSVDGNLAESQVIVQSESEKGQLTWKSKESVKDVARKMMESWRRILGKGSVTSVPLSAFVNAILAVGDVIEIDDTGQSLRSVVRSTVEVLVQDTSSTVREYVQWVSAVDALRDTIPVNLPESEELESRAIGYEEAVVKRESLKRQITALDSRSHPSNSNFMLEGDFLIPTIEMMASKSDMEGEEIENQFKSEKDASTNNTHANRAAMPTSKAQSSIKLEKLLPGLQTHSGGGNRPIRGNGSIIPSLPSNGITDSAKAKLPGNGSLQMGYASHSGTGGADDESSHLSDTSLSVDIESLDTENDRSASLKAFTKCVETDDVKMVQTIASMQSHLLGLSRTASSALDRILRTIAPNSDMEISEPSTEPPSPRPVSERWSSRLATKTTPSASPKKKKMIKKKLPVQVNADTSVSSEASSTREGNGTTPKSPLSGMAISTSIPIDSAEIDAISRENESLKQLIGKLEGGLMKEDRERKEKKNHPSSLPLVQKQAGRLSVSSSSLPAPVPRKKRSARMPSSMDVSEAENGRIGDSIITNLEIFSAESVSSSPRSPPYHHRYLLPSLASIPTLIPSGMKKTSSHTVQRTLWAVASNQRHFAGRNAPSPHTKVSTLAKQALHAFELIPSATRTLALLEEHQRPLISGEISSHSSASLAPSTAHPTHQRKSLPRLDVKSPSVTDTTGATGPLGDDFVGGWKSGPAPLAVANPWPQVSATKLRLLKQQNRASSEGDISIQSDKSEMEKSLKLASPTRSSSGGIVASSTQEMDTDADEGEEGSATSLEVTRGRKRKSSSSMDFSTPSALHSLPPSLSEPSYDYDWMKVEYLFGDAAGIGVRPSNLPVPFAGLGVFALEAIPQGRTITWYDGPRVTAEVPMPGFCKTHLHSTHLGSAPVALDGLRYPILSRGVASLINSVKGKKLYTHPNVKLDVISAKLRLSYIIRVRTLANIAPGEELFAGYSWI